MCTAEDIDESAADRYLKIVRFIDLLGTDDKKQDLLYNSTSTIQSLVNTVAMQTRAGIWKDPLERPTAAGLLRELVPVTHLRQCYEMGKRLREVAYHIWSTKRSVTVMGSRAATIMSIRQFACIDVMCTMPQAERYCRLVRFVERMAGGNPWERLRELEREHPLGLMQVLGLSLSARATTTRASRSPPSSGRSSSPCRTPSWGTRKRRWCAGACTRCGCTTRTCSWTI